LEEELEKKRMEDEKRAIEMAKKAEREQKDKERRQELRQWKINQQKKNKGNDVNVEIMAPLSPVPPQIRKGNEVKIAPSSPVPQRAVSFSTGTKDSSPRVSQPKDEDKFVVESLTPKTRKAALMRYMPRYRSFNN
jgi:hypothetical protein